MRTRLRSGLAVAALAAAGAAATLLPAHAEAHRGRFGYPVIVAPVPGYYPPPPAYYAPPPYYYAPPLAYARPFYGPYRHRWHGRHWVR
jgi:DNA-binding transcriptional LysR family regulator